MMNSAWLDEFSGALRRSNPDELVSMFAERCYWRDCVAFTWNIVTLEGRPAIEAMLRSRLADVCPDSFELEPDGDGWFTFATSVGRCRGHVRLENGKVSTLFTALTELKGHEEKSGASRPIGARHGAFKDRVSWGDRRKADGEEIGHSRQPFVLIVGGGQGGIALGARLKRLDVPALIVDQNERPGDAWRNRYNSLCLHDPVWYDHMPYLPFPDHWPVYTPKDKMGDWLEAYTKIMELDYWTSSTCKGAAYDEHRCEWSVLVQRGHREITVRPKHLVLATGVSGFPEVPRFRGSDKFKGVQHHSSKHPGGEGWAGKKCVVVGSNNSAHDIAADLWEHDAEVTMLQRSPTLVVRVEAMDRYGSLYSEDAARRGVTAEHADFVGASMPYALLPALARQKMERILKDDAEFYERLAGSGFKLTFGEDNSGLGVMSLRRGSGYYIDVGASELISSGRIKVIAAGVEQLTERGLILDDGTRLDADLIVYATGYGSMNQWAAALISQEVADKVGKCWGLGSDTAKDPGPWEGELRNMWKPTAQEGLWFHGGNLAMSRHYSLYLALQLKARLEGLDTPVYARAAVHHRE
ncbi:FAD-dependent oxidoreductase [Bradyrhizobium sp. CCBAU 11386]|uniref:flavin-containing monooxygenase n=1 Tax=Bradyrhizobium sp. CCBAU 11386 TaxID=1630837 RepID=UPI002303E2BD|nr:NAD(P)/FAD-dependent oxidoreductase [Bradyrhizobium sp. CCBAU 11386]MDA9504416.1 FAD-dependent oxidoreductase [Bradyrhizobium sp. CCBAU 11386]